MAHAAWLIEAQRQADSERTRVFAMRAREMGGVTARTRPIIERDAAGAHANVLRNAYLAHGYTECGCGRLVNPNYERCYSCGAMKTGRMLNAQAIR